MYSNYLKAGVDFSEKFNFADKITQLGAKKNYLGSCGISKIEM